MALAASSSVANSTKAKPRGLPVARSEGRKTSRIDPASWKSVSSCSLVVENSRLPTKTFEPNGYDLSAGTPVEPGWLAARSARLVYSTVPLRPRIALLGGPAVEPDPERDAEAQPAEQRQQHEPGPADRAERPLREEPGEQARGHRRVDHEGQGELVLEHGGEAREARQQPVHEEPVGDHQTEGGDDQE